MYNVFFIFVYIGDLTCGGSSGGGDGERVQD